MKINNLFRRTAALILSAAVTAGAMAALYVTTGDELSLKVSAISPGEDFVTEIDEFGVGLTITGYVGESQYVDIPASINGKQVHTIGEKAFVGTDLKFISLPTTTVVIKERAFEGLENLRSIMIPDSVTTIEDYAFRGSGLEYAIIPYNVTKLGKGVYSECKKLTSLRIISPQLDWLSYRSENNDIVEDFRGCDSLNKIIVSDENSDFTTTDGVLFNKDKTELIKYPCNKFSGSYVIPDTVKKIARYAFSGGSEHGYNVLTNVVIPSGTEYIGYSAFANRPTLKSISVPQTVTTIENYAFGYNFDPVEEGGESYDTYTPADDFTLAGCKDSAAYYYTIGRCKFLDAETGETTLPEKSEEYDYYYDEKLKGIVIEKYKGTEKKVTLPERIGDYSVAGLRGYVFGGSDIEEVSLPDTVTEIGTHAFAMAKKLKKISLPSKLKTIGDEAFSHTQIKTFTVPSSVESIGTGAFSGCASLTELKIESAKLNWICERELNGYGEFVGCTSLQKITVSEKCKDYSAVNGVLFNKNGDTLVTYPCCKKDKSYIIPDGVTIICGSAFRGCSALKEVSFDGSVEKIGEYAFLGCGIKQMTLPDSLKEIGTKAFGYSVKDDTNSREPQTELIKDFKVTCEKGSAADSYCSENGIKAALTEKPQESSQTSSKIEALPEDGGSRALIIILCSMGAALVVLIIYAVVLQNKKSKAKHTRAEVPSNEPTKSSADTLTDSSADEPIRPSSDTLTDSFADEPIRPSSDTLTDSFADEPIRPSSDTLTDSPADETTIPSSDTLTDSFEDEPTEIK